MKTNPINFLKKIPGVIVNDSSVCMFDFKSSPTFFLNEYPFLLVNTLWLCFEMLFSSTIINYESLVSLLYIINYTFKTQW